MTALDLALLILIFLATSVISVVTGATSLITVPAMLQFGVEPRTAIATNMLALTFMSVGATLPFLRRDAIDRQRAPLLILLTALGSVIGALLVFAVPAELLPLIIAVMMLLVAAFIILRPQAGVDITAQPSRIEYVAGYIATLLLGVYGGFFSGGYVTLLTAAWVAFFKMPFLRAVASTKLVNAVSSLIAVIIFACRGVIDWQLGALLSVVMFLGALVGAHVTLRLSEIWIRRLFLAMVLVLAAKSLIFDLPWSRMLGNGYESGLGALMVPTIVGR